MSTATYQVPVVTVSRKNKRCVNCHCVIHSKSISSSTFIKKQLKGGLRQLVASKMLTVGPDAKVSPLLALQIFITHSIVVNPSIYSICVDCQSKPVSDLEIDSKPMDINQSTEISGLCNLLSAMQRYMQPNALMQRRLGLNTDEKQESNNERLSNRKQNCVRFDNLSASDCKLLTRVKKTDIVTIAKMAHLPMEHVALFFFYSAHHLSFDVMGCVFQGYGRERARQICSNTLDVLEATLCPAYLSPQYWTREHILSSTPAFIRIAMRMEHKPNRIILMSDGFPIYCDKPGNHQLQKLLW